MTNIENALLLIGCNINSSLPSLYLCIQGCSNIRIDSPRCASFSVMKPARVDIHILCSLRYFHIPLQFMNRTNMVFSSDRVLELFIPVSTSALKRDLEVQYCIECRVGSFSVVAISGENKPNTNLLLFYMTIDPRYG